MKLFRTGAFLLALSTPIASAWGTTPLTISSGSATPVQLTMTELSKLPNLTVTVSFMTSHGSFKGSFTGPLLWTVLLDAKALDPAKPRAWVGDTILTTGQDGYTAALATGEIAPLFENKNVILAAQMNGKPLGQNHLRLIVPGDKAGGRSVRDVVTISVEAPAKSLKPHTAPQPSKT